MCTKFFKAISILLSTFILVFLNPLQIFAESAVPIDPVEIANETLQPIDGIRDNSFFVEEAYNQERGVVQHIFTARFGVDDQGPDRERTWDLSFTQEWPVFSQTHQFSFTLPYGSISSFTSEENRWMDQQDVGDLALNYRFQALWDKGITPAFSPRFTLLLPTGNDEKGFGSKVLGYQFNLPFSKTLNDRTYINLNLGFTLQPNTRIFLANGSKSGEEDVYAFNVGGSLIYAITRDFHVLFETLWNGNQTVEEMVDSEGNEVMVTHRFFQHDVTFLPGARMAFNLPGSIQVVPGVGIPIGLSENAIDYGAFFYLSVEHPFIRM